MLAITIIGDFEMNIRFEIRCRKISRFNSGNLTRWSACNWVHFNGINNYPLNVRTAHSVGENNAETILENKIDHKHACPCPCPMRWFVVRMQSYSGKTLHRLSSYLRTTDHSSLSSPHFRKCVAVIRNWLLLSFMASLSDERWTRTGFANVIIYTKCLYYVGSYRV